jgi:hypothetical protein
MWEVKNQNRFGMAPFDSLSLKVLELPKAAAVFHDQGCPKKIISLIESADQRFLVRLLGILKTWVESYRQSSSSCWSFRKEAIDSLVDFWKGEMLTIAELLRKIRSVDVAEDVVIAVCRLVMIVISLDTRFSLFVFEQLFLYRGKFFAVSREFEKVELFETVVREIIRRGDRPKRVVGLLSAEFIVVWNAIHENCELLQIIYGFIQSGRLEIPEDFAAILLEWQNVSAS